GAGGEVPLVVIAARQAAGAGLVDVFPGGVDRQLAGDAVVPFAILGAVAVVHCDGAVLEGGGVLLGRAGLFGTIGHGVRVVEVLAVFLTFQHGVGFQCLLDFLLQVQG